MGSSSAPLSATNVVTVDLEALSWHRAGPRPLPDRRGMRGLESHREDPDTFSSFYDEGRVLPTLAKHNGAPKLFISRSDAGARHPVSF